MEPEVPSGWMRKPLLDLFDLPTGQVDPRRMPYRRQVLVAPDHVESGTGRLLAIRTAEEQNAISGKYPFESGDVIYSKIRPYLRKAVLANFDGLCSADMYPLRPKNGTAPGFLLALILGERFSRFAESVSMRSGFPKINRVELSEFVAVVPGAAEQVRIAEILDTLDETIQVTEQVIAKLEQVRRGLLHDLLTRGIDDNGEIRDPERHPEHFQDSPLGRIPKSWEATRLARVAEVRSGIAKNEGAPVSNPVEVAYLRVANVQDGYLDLSEMKTLKVSRSELDHYRVLPGDVLMNEGGDRDKLGRGAIWRGEFDPCVHQNHVFVVRCGRCLLPEFLDAWTGGAVAKRYFMVAGKQSTNLASINKTSIGKLPVALPSLAEQERGTAALGVIRARIDAERAEHQKLRLLKNGLMDDLLTGRVRVLASETPP